jgi:hypothetical protein
MEVWKEEDLPGTAVFDAKGKEAKRFAIWATPGAVVLDAQARICYRGALHAGRFCASDDLAYASKALDAVFDGKRPKVTCCPFYGCATAASDWER